MDDAEQIMGKGAPKLDRRALLFSGALLLSCAASYAVRLRSTRKPISAAEFKVVTPSQVGDYRYVGTDGVVLPIEDDLTKILYSNTRFGTYSNGVDPLIMLLVAYDRAQEYDVQIHRPETCYPAAGFTIDHRQKLDTKSILGIESEAIFLTASRDDRTEQVLYWTRIGKKFPADYAAQRLAILKDNFAGEVPDAVLLRVSTVSVDRVRARQQLLHFVHQIVDGLRGTARDIYLGR